MWQRDLALPDARIANMNDKELFLTTKYLLLLLSNFILPNFISVILFLKV